MPRFIQCCLVIIVTACESAVCAAQPANFTGTVISSSGPVEGASITLKGTPYGTVTSAKGHFIIAKPPVGTYTLQVRCLGYYDTEQTIKLPGNDNENIFYLKANPSILNAVIVTGVSKATPVKENPMPVTSLAARAIQQTVESNIIDVLVRHTPGLNAVKTGPNISKPFIRGLGYNRVLTLYDGMRQEGQQWGDEHGIEVDEYNIQKAEVIKGPASLMYGSDALAGVVSLFPAAPAETDAILHGKITTEYQTNNNLTGSGVYLGHNNGRWLYGVRAGYRIAKNYRNA
ncbi:MAG TPA: TonB-dependent receptor plug domain-containing protein, partial [Chitinophagaceae bacterium]|nr:TonB-dependent receptor plug domain-containing protein [Chitinophagaceae bacterium]